QNRRKSDIDRLDGKRRIKDAAIQSVGTVGRGRNGQTQVADFSRGKVTGIRCRRHRANEERGAESRLHPRSLLLPRERRTSRQTRAGLRGKCDQRVREIFRRLSIFTSSSCRDAAGRWVQQYSVPRDGGRRAGLLR